MMAENITLKNELQLLSQNPNVCKKVGAALRKEEAFEGRVLQLLDHPDTTKRATSTGTINRLRRKISCFYEHGCLTLKTHMPLFLHLRSASPDFKNKLKD